MTDASDTIRNRNRDLLACSTVHQTICLSHRPNRLLPFEQTVNSELYMSILCSRVMTLRVAVGLPIMQDFATRFSGRHLRRPCLETDISA